jgi:hypothetical protein
MIAAFLPRLGPSQMADFIFVPITPGLSRIEVRLGVGDATDVGLGFQSVTFTL